MEINNFIGCPLSPVDCYLMMWENLKYQATYTCFNLNSCHTRRTELQKFTV